MSVSSMTSLPSAAPMTNASGNITTQPLTSHLLAHNPHLFTLATTHPFLRSAGQGTLPKSTLSRWLSQDRIYAQSYISFIGALIARIHLPYANVTDKSASLRWKIVKLLSDSLQNIHRELDFFATTAEKYGLNLEVHPLKEGASFEPTAATRQYESLFRAFGSDPSMTLLEGLVVLWATEQVYLSAWRHAASQYRQPANGDSSPVRTSLNGTVDKNGLEDLDGGALRKDFIPNWTSPEFESFVQQIADVVNELSEREEGWRKIEVFKAVWEHVLEIERRFWPDIGVSN